MPVLATDIKYYESLDTDSLGGGIGSLVVPTGLNLFFSDVDYEEATVGSTAYRCFYIKNENIDSTLLGAEIYIAQVTPSPSTSCQLGIGSSGLNGTEQSITSENIAPVGVNFFGASEGSPLPMADLGPDDYFPIWIKRTVQPLAVGTSNDNVILAVRGDGGA